MLKSGVRQKTASFCIIGTCKRDNFQIRRKTFDQISGQKIITVKSGRCSQGFYV